MALTLFVNTYLVDATSYLGGYTDWASATNEEKEQALVTATNQLDAMLWAGTAAAVNQPLAWPRLEFSFFDPVLNLYVPVAAGEAPIRLQKAVAMLALHMLRYPEVEKGFEQSFDSITVGPISISNSDAGKDPGRIPAIPASVRKLVSPLVVGGDALAWWRSN